MSISSIKMNDGKKSKSTFKELFKFGDQDTEENESEINLQEYKIEVETVDLRELVPDVFSEDGQSLRKVLKAHWTVTVSFLRPPLITRVLQQRYSRVRVTIKCNGLHRKVLVEGYVQFDIINPNFLNKQHYFSNIFKEGNSDFIIDLKLGDENIFDLSGLKGELKFKVSPENYFYFFHEVDILHTAKDIQENKHQILNDLSDDLDALYQKEQFSDVQLRCGEKTFKCHKIILSSRSPVFGAMFTNPMKESQDGVVNIEDMEPDVLQVVLLYLYSGKTTGLTGSTACELLSAADRYQLPALKRVCIIYLQTNMSVDNVLRTLEFADLHDSGLKKCSIEYICKKFERLKDTEEWKTFQNDRASLANQVLHEIIQFVSSRPT